MPTATQEAQASAVLNAYTQTSQRLRASTMAKVMAIWGSLDSWRDADIASFVKQVVPHVLAGQDHTAALTAAYLNKTVSILGPNDARSIPVPTKGVTGAIVRNGSSPADVYSRMGQTIYRALGQGDDIDAAVKKATDRLTKTAQTDLQLSRTWASRAVISKAKGIVGWRRMLTGDKSCALCVVASTRTYRKADLMPMHPGCDCVPVPVIGSEFMPSMDQSEKDVLDAAHAEIKARLGVDTNQASKLRELTVVHDHGELGPVLAVRDQHFTSQSDL